MLVLEEPHDHDAAGAITDTVGFRVTAVIASLTKAVGRTRFDSLGLKGKCRRIPLLLLIRQLENNIVIVLLVFGHCMVGDG